jgi:hypothetical protein
MTNEKVTGSQAPWLALEGLTLPEGDPSRCHDCGDKERSRVVSISPRSFNALTQSEPRIEMPDRSDGYRNYGLWEAYESANRERPDMQTPSFAGRLRERGESELAVYFEPAALLGASTRDRVYKRATAMVARNAKNRQRDENRAQSILKRQAKCALWLIDEVDAKAILSREDPGIDRDVHLQRIVSDLRRAMKFRNIVNLRVEIVDGKDQERIEKLRDLLKLDAKKYGKVLLFSSGVRRGTTLQRLLVDIQDAWRPLGTEFDGELEVHSLVLHAHPSDPSVWAALRNAFSGSDGSRLAALWLTYLPEGRSPQLEASRNVFGKIDTRNLDKRVQKLVQSLGVTSPDPSLDWLLSGEKVELRRTSVYGDALSARVTLAAVGAAMHRIRCEARRSGAQSWFQFDLPRVFRSYFDALIHAAVLRWVQPSECWWGSEPSECVAVLAEVEAQDPDGWKFLLPELCLAAAQGKVPEEGMHALRSACYRIIEKSEWTKEEQEFVALGLSMVDQALLLSATT